MNSKVLSLLLFLFLMQVGIEAQQLTHRQGEILIELHEASTPVSLIEGMKDRFGEAARIGANQVIASPMNIWKVTFDFAKINQREILALAKQSDEVLNAQNNHILSYRKLPNDPEIVNQWQYLNDGSAGGLENADLDIDAAWDITTGGVTASGDTIVVCVIDDGLDPTHEDFGDNIWINRAEIPGNEVDDDNNGFVDDYRGWDTYEGGDDIYIAGGHGTPVIGIVGAKGNNELGVSGVNWDVKVMVVRGGGDEANALASYAYPYLMRKRYNETNGQEGAFVVSTNASWGINFGLAEDAPLWCNFYDSLGMVGIVSSGATINDEVNVDVEGDLPTSCESEFLISVSNITRAFEKAQFAGFGTKNIDLGAFGSEVYTTAFGNNYGPFGGTSAAAPQVAGAIALLYAMPYPEISSLAINDPAAAARFMKDVILNSVRKDEKFRDLFRTSGVLNLKNATELVANVFGACPFPIAVEVENITLDSTEITWETDENVSAYDLRYRLVGDTIWTEIPDVSSPTPIQDLMVCGSYELQLRARCETNDTSAFSFSRTFTTLGCCDAPKGLFATSDPQEVEENAILLSWNDDQDHLSYEIVVNVQGSSKMDTFTSMTNAVLLDSLQFCAAYDIRVRAACITGILTEFSTTIEAATSCGRCTTLPYCTPPAAENFGEWIESITLDGQKAETGADLGYGEFGGFFDLDLRVGTEIELKVEKGFDDIAFEEWVKVWIDLNVDGEFSEDELYFDEGEATFNDIDTTIIVQGDVSPGLTRMRIGMLYLEEPQACLDPEELFLFGEYEDYCVNLIGPCDYGLEIETIEPGRTDANIIYTAVDTSIAYNVRYKGVAEDDDAWETVTSLDTSTMISSLEECTDYVVQVRAVCLVDTSGFEAVSDTFQTIGPDCMVNTDEEWLALWEVKAFPNPFVNQLNLQVESLFETDIKVKVFNVNGQLMEQSNAFIPSGVSRIHLKDSESWQAGIYFVQIKSESFESMSKVIKLSN